MFTAFSASAAKKQIGKQRDQIKPSQGIATALAMTSFLRKAFSCREPEDADI
jgi:hypothetical protein